MPHNLAFIGIAQYNGLWLAECECHDPDGDWHGRRDYYGTSYTDVYDQWLDHHNEKVSE